MFDTDMYRCCVSGCSNFSVHQLRAGGGVGVGVLR